MCFWALTHVSGSSDSLAPINKCGHVRSSRMRIEVVKPAATEIKKKVSKKIDKAIRGKGKAAKN